MVMGVCGGSKLDTHLSSRWQSWAYRALYEGSFNALSSTSTMMPLSTFGFLIWRLQNSIESLSNFSGVILLSKLELERN